MPLTFLSHQAVVLPLKLGVPRAVSGTALVLGSMAPDVEYYVRGIPAATLGGHGWPGQLTHCLPVTLALYWIVTRVIAVPLALHLPSGGSFRLRDYALIRHAASSPAEWLTVAMSALVGSTSHVILDRATGGWSTTDYAQRQSWIPAGIIPSDRGWAIIQVVLWIALAFATLAMLRHIGRRGLLRAWASRRGAPAAPRLPDSARPVAFWGVICGAGLVATAWGAAFPRPDYHLHEAATWVQIGLRTLSCMFVALVIVSAAWHLGARSRHSTPGESQ